MVRCIKILLYPLAWLLGINAAAPANKRQHMFLLLISEAWVSINTNRIRAFLAMLGIIIGVGSVILMVSIGSGSQRRVEKSINSLGTNLLIISDSTPPQKDVRRNSSPALFKVKDVDAIADLPYVEVVSYSTSISNNDITVDSVSENLPILGIEPEVLTLRNWTFDEGDTFTAEDLKLRNRVAVIGADVATRFFPEESAVGRNILFGSKKIALLVIGVIQPKGTAPDGQRQDNSIFIPITTFNTYVSPGNQRPIQFLYVKVSTAEAIEQVTDDVRTTLRQMRSTPDDVGDNFTIHNLGAIMKVASDATAAFSALLGSIASISLVVGSIGIMNIMLVTVSERTREIGIRKAIGATEKQILIQFLLEAIMISCVGSLIGLMIGIGGGVVADTWFSVPAEFGLDVALMSLIMAVGIGIISGLYPAYKAAKMQPIEALRNIGN